MKFGRSATARAMARGMVGWIRGVEECEAVWSRQGRCATESSNSRWVPAAAAVVGGGASAGESSSSNRETGGMAMWGAGILAAVVAVEVGRWDGTAFADSAEPRVERSLSSPMGRTPASKLAQPTFFLSGGFCVLSHYVSSFSFHLLHYLSTMCAFLSTLVNCFESGVQLMSQWHILVMQAVLEFNLLYYQFVTWLILEGCHSFCPLQGR